MYCTQCGTEIGDGGNFCPKCGKSAAPPPTGSAPAQGQLAGVPDFTSGASWLGGFNLSSPSWRWGLVAVLVVLVGVGVFFAVGRASHGAGAIGDSRRLESRVQDGVRLMNKGDWEGIYKGFLTSAARRTCTEAKFVEYMNGSMALFRALGGKGAFGIRNLTTDVRGTVGKAMYTFTVGGDVLEPYTSANPDLWLWTNGDWYSIEKDTTSPCYNEEDMRLVRQQSASAVGVPSVPVAQGRASPPGSGIVSMTTGAAAYKPGDASAGKQLFTRKGCTGCHTITGLAGAVGTVGPNLTHIASQKYGNFPNDPGFLKQWINNPQVSKPGTADPKLGLTDQELNDVVTYLQQLK